MCMMNSFVVCILPLSYSIGRGLRELGTWCGKKDMFSYWTYLVSSSNGLSVVRRTTSIFHVEVACAICIIRARYVHFFVFLVHTMFLWVQGSNPWPCSTTFLLVPGSIPGPGRLFQASRIRGLCHSPPRLEDQVVLQKNKTSMRKKIC